MKNTTSCRLTTTALLASLTVAGAAWLGGCSTGLPTLTASELRESLLSEHRAKLEGRAKEVRTERAPSELEQSLERVLEKAKQDGIDLPKGRQTVEDNIKAADQLSGVGAYEGEALDVGKDLLGSEETPAVVLDLKSALRKAIKHNLDLAVARLNPEISEQRVIQAEAVFDTVLFGGANWSKLDTPRPPGVIPGLSGDQQSEALTFNTGVRKQFDTGGVLTAQAQVQRQEQTPSFFGVNRFYDADVLVQLEQPLLQGFGSDVTRANIQLAGIAQQADQARLRSSMLDLALGVEQAYWQLAAARNTLLIQSRLLTRTVKMRDKLEKRFGFDLLLADLNEINARVDARKADLIRARQNVLTLSDRLKRLINDPELPLIDETVLVPSESPADVAISYSLLDQVTTALKRRPEIETALLQIDDAEIRRVFADNAQLPVLNLVASTTLNGFDVNSGFDALGKTAELDYLDYALGIEFERPWGNRTARSAFEERVLQKKQALESYRSTAQAVTLEVKDAMRGVDTNYRLIATARSQRRASALSLEVAEIQLDQGGRNEAETFTTRVDRVLARQDALAQAELAEAQSLSDYMVAISQLHRATGTSLEKAGVEVDKAEDE